MPAAAEIFKKALIVLPILWSYSACLKAQTPSAPYDANFTLRFNGVSGEENDGFRFFILPDRIVIDEPTLSDDPGRESTIQSLMLSNVGEWQCREKNSPAYNPGIAYERACGELISRTQSAFVMEHTVYIRNTDGSETRWQYRVSAQAAGVTCRVQLLSYQRTYRNMPGVFMSPASGQQSCRAI
jgi:hypothetical protein